VFKLIGVIVGYLLLGFWGGLLGLFVGGFVDLLRVVGASGMNPLQHALRQAVFLETLFISMGKLAKADGHISQDEVNHVELFIEKIGMTPDHRLQAVAWFKRGADADFDIEVTYKKFNETCGRTQNLKQMLLVYLIVMALADGHFHEKEQALLAEIASHLGFQPAEFQRVLDMVMNQAHFAGGAQVNSPAALEDAYKALGVTAENSDADIKRAYRKLMSQYHPDKLMGQGMPEDMIAVATEQAKEIQLAYDLIKKNRNL